MTTPSAEAMEKAKEVYHSWCEIDVPDENMFDRIIGDIAQALEAYAQEALAQRDLEQFGESFVLNGKRIGPNEIYKSTADYVKEARTSALEDAAKIADHLAETEEYAVPGLWMAKRIRALIPSGKPERQRRENV